MLFALGGRQAFAAAFGFGGAAFFAGLRTGAGPGAFAAKRSMSAAVSAGFSTLGEWPAPLIVVDCAPGTEL